MLMVVQKSQVERKRNKGSKRGDSAAKTDMRRYRPYSTPHTLFTIEQRNPARWSVTHKSEADSKWSGVQQQNLKKAWPFVASVVSIVLVRRSGGGAEASSKVVVPAIP
ncbi:unnamed protein product [Cercospora beticola]|nr:unnamed protein product [Cercospora beticola]